MDPTEAELQQINDVRGAMDWAGVDGDLENALLQALGGVQRVREVPLITRPAWDLAVQNLQVPDQADPAVHGPPNARPLRPVEQARVESFRRVCCLRVGRPADEPGAQAPLPPQAGVLPIPNPGGAGNAQGARKLKLSAILDPTLDAEVISIPPNEQAQLYEAYRAKYGDFPGADADPSPDQLAALRQVIQAGALPFACFTTFGPHGQRLLRKQTFTSFTLNVSTGEWARKEQPGPSNYHEWFKCWRVYRTTMLLLDCCDSERLDNYAEVIRSFVTQFGEECWFLVARADAQMRSEHMERLRRELRATPNFGYTDVSPWAATFMAACKDHEF